MSNELPPLDEQTFKPPLTEAEEATARQRMPFVNRILDCRERQLAAALAEKAELTQKLADNDLAFEHAQEVILAHEQENAELKKSVEVHNDSAVEAWNLTRQWQKRVYELEPLQMQVEALTLANRALKLQRDAFKAALKGLAQQLANGRLGHYGLYTARSITVSSERIDGYFELLARTDTYWREMAEKEKGNG